ncbi:MAG: NADH-quinone oxidoreductase subunit L [Nitrospirota bacterium]
MKALLWLIPAFPFAGFLVLALAGRHLPRPAAATAGAAATGLSMAAALTLGTAFLAAPPQGHALSSALWTWISVEGFAPAIAFRLDALSLVMMLVITTVGFLIQLYSVEFMENEEGYSRFFAFTNLFIFSMLVLVLADNLLLLYLGWEGVGLCSYLLIGFWYRDPANGYAARKAFVVTRVGDAALALGLFLLFSHLGTLHIQELMARAERLWTPDALLPVAAAALLLAGAVGKSAQLPLQVWLPDAMAGPTPVSALIHAATMVTAGVYLIARTNVIFQLAPSVQFLVALIGASTMLLAGFSALAQRDIKRVLAYSTMSQIGYMFLALGVGAWSAAIFHFMTHAFFKALLFLGAGAVIVSLHHEHDLSRMGGLRRQMPLVFWPFLIGALSLSALPVVTAGFYSKDLILYRVWASGAAGPWLWTAGVLGTFITSLYTFRMVFSIFFGTMKTGISARPGALMLAPLVVLAIPSLVAGVIEMPGTFSYIGGNLHLFTSLMHTALPPFAEVHLRGSVEVVLEAVIEAVQLSGILLAYLLFLRRTDLAARLAGSRTGEAVRSIWYAGWGFDRLYDALIVRPFLWAARVNRNDVIDLLYLGVAQSARGLNRLAVSLQTGKVRWYASGMVLGAVLLLAFAVLL